MYAKGLGFLFLAAIIAVVTAAILIVRHRRQIVSTLDKAAVDTLAKGVKAGRNVSGRAAAYRQRIVDRADER